MSNQATHEQVQVISDLIADVFKGDTETQRIYTGSVVTAKYDGKLSHDRAEEMISNLKRRKGEQTRRSTVDIRTLTGGRYAVRDEQDNRVRFFKINTSKRTGTMFVDEQAGPEFYPVGKQFPTHEWYVGRYADLLQIIVNNEQAAFELYGQELGYCGVCGRELTDETSRERGIGPVCYEKQGYEHG